VQIAALEKDLADFYVPAFVVKIAGEDVLRDLYLPVSAVSVDLKEKKAGHFSFTVVSAFDWDAGEFLATQNENRIDLLELFAFGSPVEISLGYGDPKKLKPMLTGLITEITTDFNSGSTPELSISGYDDLYPLTVGKNTKHWEDKPDSAAVEDIARKRGVSSNVQATSPSKLRIDQNNETDMAFIEKLTERNRESTFYHRDKKLYFGPRHYDTSAVVELERGKGLLSFSPEANLAHQVAEVRVHGWSATKGEVIVGVARKGDELGRDAKSKSGGERVVTALPDEPVLNLRAAVHTQAEADARARAVLQDRAQDFVKGTGESLGVPEILPDTNITIKGLGRAFSRTYYVSEATHKINGSGYRTSFKVERPTV
jgi:Bacteriophage probable baseplate hub protein